MRNCALQPIITAGTIFGFVSQNRIRLPPCGIGEDGREFRGRRAAHTRKVNLRNEANSGHLSE
jgi:hypothetical protein